MIRQLKTHRAGGGGFIAFLITWTSIILKSAYMNELPSQSLPKV